MALFVIVGGIVVFAALSIGISIIARVSYRGIKSCFQNKEK